jgi:hypothetical protein
MIDELLIDESPTLTPRFDDVPVKLENRGVTSHPETTIHKARTLNEARSLNINPQWRQTTLWAKQTIHKNSVAAKLRSIGQHDIALKLENCHTHYTFAVCTGCGGVSKFPNRCDQFFCPECQPRLSMDRKRAVEWWTHEISQPKHVVLTIRNFRSLGKKQIQFLRDSFTRLRRSKFARNWIGGFYSMETTKEGRGWHLHLHCLAEAKWIDAIQLSEQWRASTRGLGYIVKVKDARDSNYLAEVTKYAVKGVELACWSPEDILTFITAFDGVRTFGVFGSLYGKRTQFAEWFKFLRDNKPLCKCGCREARYYDEHSFLELDLIPSPTNSHTIPPPVVDHPEFSQFANSDRTLAALAR